MWRSQDEALLRRLENELAMEQLWRQQAGAAAEVVAPLPARAAGMIEVLRGGPGSVDAGATQIEALIAATELAEREGRAEGEGQAAERSAAAARTESSAAWGSRLWPRTLVGYPAPLLHHLAVFHRHLADARLARLLDSRGRDTRKIGNIRGPRYAAVLAGRRLSIACWLALRAEGRYLAELCRAVMPAADPVQLERAAERAVLAPIEAFGGDAREGAGSCSLRGALALQALVDLPDAIRVSGCSRKLAQPVSARAERLQEAAVDDALQPITEALDDSLARGTTERDAAAMMARLAGVWRWSGENEHVERYALTQVKPIAWNVYQREPGFENLRALLTPLLPLLDRAAERIEGDPERIAYAAPCAQMFVFRAEMAEGGPDSLPLAEQALRLCPTHRNARLILAGLLARQVREQLDPSTFLRSAALLVNSKAELDAMQAKLDRAESLYPQCEILPNVRRMLAAARRATLVGR